MSTSEHIHITPETVYTPDCVLCGWCGVTVAEKTAAEHEADVHEWSDGHTARALNGAMNPELAALVEEAIRR